MTPHQAEVLGYSRINFSWVSNVNWTLLAPFLVIWSFNCHALHCTLALDPFLAKNVE